jgi:2-polyprenyl-3-methyl-5-hydroxy-6-metoxy-1,4-benzoquinol methylase
MSSLINEKDREQINAGIREKYHKVAISPEGQFYYPTGIEGLKKLGYDNQIIEDLPNSVADSFCGVGNPFSLGKIDSGAVVLDIGCGSGVDALIAAKLVGASGKVLGIDITSEMIQKANANKELMAADNVNFQVASVHDIADMDGGFDVIISNGVFNLIPDKDEALQKAYGLLKPGGRIFLCDQVLTGPLTTDLKQRVASWFQ